MTLRQRLLPRTLLVRTFLLVSLLIFVSVVTWLTLFAFAESEPRARQVAQLTVSVVNVTTAALINADPVKRLALLRDLADSEGVRLYPAEPDDDVVTPLADTFFFRVMSEAATLELGPRTRFAGSINGEVGIWVRFAIGDTPDDDYWLMLPAAHAESDFPWHWLGWGGASLALALLVAWLIVSRVTSPLRALAAAAAEVGRGRHPPPVAERGALELQQLAETFNRMSASLQRSDAERAEVLAGISHDLRTPLARLRLEAEMSIADAAARDAVSEDIEQMDAIVAQFLDYARGDNGERVEPADINALVAQAVGAHTRAATISQTTEDELPAIPVQRQALTRALSNLIDNARKYAGGEIAVETRRRDAEIVIDVVDRGPGVPQSEVERLKRPFTRLESARTNVGGTGLGLAIVDRLVRGQGGAFELLPRPGGGLIARLRLPIR